MKSTKRLSQLQRMRRSRLRHLARRVPKQRKPGQGLPNTPGMERRNWQPPMPKPKFALTLVRPHTFGDPRSPKFWANMLKSELLSEAKDRNIRGRSAMTKEELVEALASHERGNNA